MAQTTSSKNSLPDGITQTGTIVKYELLNYRRSRRYFVMLIIVLAIGALMTSLLAYFRPELVTSNTLAFYSTLWGSWSNLVIVLSGIFFGGDAISSEFQNKTGYFLVGNPIRRSSIYAGKLVGAFLAALSILVVFAAIATANGLLYFGTKVPIEFGESFLFSVLYLAAVLGLTFFFSSFFKSNSVSIIVSVILLIFVFPVIQSVVASIAKVEPWFLVTYAADIINAIFTVPYPPQVFTPPAGNFSFTTYTPAILEGLAIMAVYFIATAVGGLWLFEKKEFT